MEHAMVKAVTPVFQLTVYRRHHE